jgi:hypothetical protein
MDVIQITRKGKARNAGMFKPGVSGNPKGRPKNNVRVTELARQCSTDAVKALFDIAMSCENKDSDRIRAISVIFDRAFGKP